ncbi:PH domain-containing protein [Pseudoluteimonas lycopersici]|uniref:PH domain-containing protein n=1 Tax=Pseudoluteimonas lycopersici TaxID=1324796 RepID=A0A516V6H2_9GAMM|nr:PH domain-containing protein [Lysobacter lycopersici]QDQ74118.1 PH domain-containing protein [Lysobacter lycopersici]
MNDERIEWSGHPSQWQNLWWFVACVLLVPIPWAFWRWLETRNTTYTLTGQRLKTTRGVFTRSTEDLELYRVRDSRFEQNLAERMLGLGQVVLFTTDETSPEIRMTFIKDAEAVREKIRTLVEARRDAKRVRYLDAE